MNWFRNTRLNLFLSFWLLWSTVGIKVYLEYCSCAQDIHFNLFELQNNSCSDISDYLVEINDHEEGAENSKKCCSAEEDQPICPPKGCDSQDVQEFKVHSPFIPSSIEKPSIDHAAVALINDRPNVIAEPNSIKAGHFLQLSDNCLSSLEFRIMIQSFLC